MARGPDGVREFMGQKHKRKEFDPTFSFLLLAEVTAFESGHLRDTDPPTAAKWAGVAADIYELLIRYSRPQDEYAREHMGRSVVLLRTHAVGPDTPIFVPAVASDPDGLRPPRSASAPAHSPPARR